MKPTVVFRPGQKAAPTTPAQPVVRVKSPAELELERLRAEAAARSQRYRKNVREKLERLKALEGGS